MPTHHDSETPNAEANINWQILDLLIDEDNQRSWSIEEVVRAHGHEQNALDGLDRLQAFGLIHRAEGFVFATRAAIRYSQIAG
jgi:hypothetical protein